MHLLILPLPPQIVTTREYGSPSTVRNITAALVSDKEIRVSWTSPTHPNGEIAKYDIIVEPLHSEQKVIAISVKPKSTYCAPCSENVHALIPGPRQMLAWMTVLLIYSR